MFSALCTYLAWKSSVPEFNFTRVFLVAANMEWQIVTLELASVFDFFHCLRPAFVRLLAVTISAVTPRSAKTSLPCAFDRETTQKSHAGNSYNYTTINNFDMRVIFISKSKETVPDARKNLVDRKRLCNSDGQEAVTYLFVETSPC